MLMGPPAQQSLSFVQLDPTPCELSQQPYAPQMRFWLEQQSLSVLQLAPLPAQHTDELPNAWSQL